MGIIIKKSKDYYTKLPLWLIIIVFIGISPALIGFIGAYFTELLTGKSCHEGNCFWGVLPWFCMLTIPSSVVLFIIYIVILVIDTFQLMKSKK